jgi:hypothetical protein
MITLKFTSAALLWQFKQIIKTGEVEINLKELNITCRCEEKEISFAIQHYKAVVLLELLELNKNLQE